jgi:AhpC/TSA family protein
MGPGDGAEAYPGAMAIALGADAPRFPAIDRDGPHALVFYKSTCSVTQMAGPPIATLGDAFPGAVLGVGQDPQETLDSFAEERSWSFPQVPDLAPYEVSDAYGIMSAPTLVVIDADGRVADVVESWDRDGMNGAAAVLAGLLDTDAPTLSTPDDGLPSFKPG